MLRATKREAGSFTLRATMLLITLEQYLCASTNSHSPFFPQKTKFLGDEHTEKGNKARLQTSLYYNALNFD